MTVPRYWATVLLVVTALYAQHRVDPKNSYYRVIAVVPLVPGLSGTAPWPKHVPTSETQATGIIAYASERSDDGQHAIIELVALNRASLASVLSDRSPGVIVFEKGKAPAGQIESAIKPFRKDFSLSTFGVAVQ